jgi:L-histidine Nalpha-methyltransferase
MARGETIHTENSVKYSLHGARLLLRAGGWTPIADWTDREQFLSLILAEESVAESASYLVRQTDHLRNHGMAFDLTLDH